MVQTITEEHRRKAAELACECASTHRGPDPRLLAEIAKLERTLRERVAGGSGPPDAAAAWLIDNYSFLRGQIREVREAMPRAYYRHLPTLVSGEPRMYRVVREWLAISGEEIDLEDFTAFLLAFQDVTRLELSELWAAGPILKMALLEDLGRAEHEDRIRRSVTALRAMETASWKDFVESVSLVEAILRQDPTGVYGRMDFETRDAYRHGIEAVARASRLSEEEVARAVLELARDTGEHVGRFLSGDGLAELRNRTGARRSLRGEARERAYTHPNVLYLGAGSALAAGIVALACRIMWPVPFWLPLLLFVPATQVALAILNPLVNLLVPPRRLPRLDFSEGIPDECRTFVVIPTLLLSRQGVERLLERLEIHHLANRDPNLYFALLTDFPDSATPAGERDYLLDICVQGIRQLNERYEGAPFFLFHRDRRWNPSENVWMGWERKRGKLEDFNRLLLGEADGFSTRVGDVAALGPIRYVITLDSDTQLPRDTARKLVATMAHPLNHPVIDRASNIVREGYAVMQPRVSVSMESAGRSRLARLLSGQTGFDPYTTAVSDLYQDLHARASFTGKGIYDVRAFHAVVGGRFPENSLLSHDLIEGEHARTGLVTDLEVIDDYPGAYQAWSKRKHRWVRGDWQIARWILPRVPAPAGPAPNPLPAVSRWKIADNLRRSLFEISVVLLLLAGWFVLPGTPVRWTLLALAFLFAPAYTEFAMALPRIPPPRFWRAWSREVAFRFCRAHGDALVNVVFLAHQAVLMADAILRTLVRVFHTHKRLLEWESMAQAEESTIRRPGLVDRYLLAMPFAGLLLALLLPGESVWDALAVIVIELWMLAPLAARWLNGPPPARKTISAPETDYLRETALRAWRYFGDLCGPEHNWLAPDNIQGRPAKTADRASPTNMGLILASNLAALDFGYLTPEEAALRLAGGLQTLERLERFRGHFYNWYDTRTLQTLEPRFVSTVDSGNLAACLVSVKQGCLDLLGQPFPGPQITDGLSDHARRLKSALPPGARTSTIARLLASLLRQLEYRPADLFGWEGVLTEARAITLRLGESIEWVLARQPAAAGEIRYWYRSLSGRIDTAIGGLYAFAPWLAAPFEMELRSHSADPRFSELLAHLERVTPPVKLPAQYDAIQTCIRALLDGGQPMRPALRATLEHLLDRLPAASARAEVLARSLEDSAALAGRLVEEMDFTFLFDRKRKLLRIGYDDAAGVLDPSSYDLLASEARTAVFLAIAKGDVPREAWFHLGRKLTACQGQRTLISWSGSMFEYLMPALFMRTYEHTLLAESAAAAVRIQQSYGRGRGVPWGISEAAYNALDSASNYQYQAFGIPEASLKQAFSDDTVVAPYATVLAVMVDPLAAVRNLIDMEARGWTGKYGFYEAIDFSPRRTRPHQRHAIVNAFMVHHEGMSLLALANSLLAGSIVRRFHSDPVVQATEYLLQERIPLLPAVVPEEQPLAALARQRMQNPELQADTA